MNENYTTALRAATMRLSEHSPTARLDAELLLAAVCGVSRMRLLAEWETPLTAEQQTQFKALIDRRAMGEPVAYLLGYKEFYGRSFVVDHRVLVPRPETELLIEQSLHWAAGQARPLVIADIGTGSGCIAITLALELPSASILAVDLSPDALAVAQTNVALHRVADRVRLLQGNGLDPLTAPVDLLVSNPPYTILAEVEPNVRQFEPHLALDGYGPAGLTVIEHLLANVPRALRPGGALFMEIGAWQGPAVVGLAQAALPQAHIALHQDLAGLDRLLAVTGI